MQHVRLTAPGSPMCDGQRWILNVPTILLWYTRTPGLGLDPKDPAILGLKALTQPELDTSTTRLTVQASSNCATLPLKVLLA